ncbi:MAG: dehydrogenase [Candidatus Syntrophonatronum acetioxidans]|uniref:Dehydrogenase n=1 Tax=Candidatus Syntrophonatronum acetioxidans TaxID=1795816 RepID=A0A424YHI7_9FIRM|nr:MAG: dehydrogenase [Candidatus Syntrophonatronum acetioxidans]
MINNNGQVHGRQTYKESFCELCSGYCRINFSFQEKDSSGITGQKDYLLRNGPICPKGMALKELLNSPERLKSPFIKRDGKHLEVSQEEALNFLVDRISEIKKVYGAEALGVHVGKTGIDKEFYSYLKEFCNVFGTPNISTAESHCHFSKKLAAIITYGALPVPDYNNSNCIVLWGANPEKSCPPAMYAIRRACRRGAKLIVVDPRKTGAAKKSNIYLQIKPGTDCALALALIHVIIKEKLYNRDFVEKWTVGFEKLIKMVEKNSPDWAEEITGINSEKIIEAAFLYSNSSPACIYQGISVELQSQGFQGLRAINILQAICGNIDVFGGLVFSPSVGLAPLNIKDKLYEGEEAIGQDIFPLFHKYFNIAQANIFSESILNGKPYPLKGLIIFGSNPVLTWPNINKVKRAFEQLEFLAVIDPFMTETARTANLVIPVASFLGRNEFIDLSPVNGIPKLLLSPKVVKEALPSDLEICFRFAEKMGYKDYLPWNEEEKYLDYRLKPLSIDLNNLSQYSKGFEYDIRKEKKYLSGSFKTESGKIEIYSEKLEKMGYDPLPCYRESSKITSGEKKIEQNFTYILTTGAREIPYMHSQYRNIPSLRRLLPEPLLEINPDDAKDLKLKDGEIVFVESTRGRVEIKAKVTYNIMPGVISMPHGWAEANANLLTDDKNLDEITGFPSSRSILARVIKKH